MFGFFLVNITDMVIKNNSSARGGAEYNLYEVNITIMDDGSLNITELWDVDLFAYSGEYRYGYRIMHVSGFDDII